MANQSTQYDQKRRTLLKIVGAGFGSSVMMSKQVRGSSTLSENKKIPDIEVNESSGNSHTINAEVKKHTKSGTQTIYDDQIKVQGGEFLQIYDVFKKRSGIFTLGYSLDDGDRDKNIVSPVLDKINNHMIHFYIGSSGFIDQSNLHEDRIGNSGGS